MRVRTETRREAILDMAAQVFMEMGYERASMAEIAKRAGGSKATLYGYFPSKEELFMSVVLHKVGTQVESAFSKLALHADKPPRALLTEFCERVLSVVTTHEAVALKRLIIAHMTNGAVAKRFWDLGPQQMLNALETYIAAATMAGRLNAKYPSVAAKHMLALCDAEIQWGGHPGLEPEFTSSQLKLIAARAVDVFMAAYGPDQTDPGHC